jgi:hypothetical protein
VKTVCKYGLELELCFREARGMSGTFVSRRTCRVVWMCGYKAVVRNVLRFAKLVVKTYTYCNFLTQVRNI